MSSALVIKPITAKDQMNNHLENLAVGEGFTILEKDRGKWATHLSNHVHPYADKKYSITTGEQAGEGLAYVQRIK